MTEDPSQPRRLGGIVIHLDTNLINSHRKIHSVNRLEEWGRNGVIELAICLRVQEEATADHDALRTAKAMGQAAWLPCATTEYEKKLWRDIENVVFPRAATSPPVRQRQLNDVEILFTAWKCHAILVTRDGASKRQPGGILGSRDALAQLYVKVMTDEEAVQLIINKLLFRDRNAIDCWKVMGRPLPAWVGQDAPENADEIRRYLDAVQAETQD